MLCYIIYGLSKKTMSAEAYLPVTAHARLQLHSSICTDLRGQLQGALPRVYIREECDSVRRVLTDPGAQVERMVMAALMCQSGFDRPAQVPRARGTWGRSAVHHHAPYGLCCQPPRWPEHPLCYWVSLCSPPLAPGRPSAATCLTPHLTLQASS